MEQTTPKPRRGRKPNAKSVDTATEKKAPPAVKKLKREDVKIEAREFESLRGQATYMLMQSGVTVYDEDKDMVREIRYCERENSIYKDEQNPASVKTPVIFRMGKLFVPR